MSPTSYHATSPTDSGKLSSVLESTARIASTHSAIIPHHISIPSAFQMPTSWNVADGQPRTLCRRFTAMHSLTRSTQWRSRLSQRSKIRSNINYHSNNKSPAKRQIQRLTGYFICRQRGSNPLITYCLSIIWGLVPNRVSV